MRFDSRTAIRNRAAVRIYRGPVMRTIGVRRIAHGKEQENDG